jgi:hypothetical protein
VHITIECPHCHNQFHVEPTLRGKSTRCPTCRKIFDVSSAEVLLDPDEADFAPVPEQPPAPSVLQTSGNVGDVIPLLNAEIAAPTPPRVTPPAPAPETVEASWAVEAPLPLGQIIDVPPPKAVPPWQQPPPVRQPGPAIPSPAPPGPAAEEDTSWMDLPPAVEPAHTAPTAPVPEGSTVADWSAANGQAPPVRTAGATDPTPSRVAAPPPPANPPNWPLRILAALVVLGLGSLGAFALIIFLNRPDTEDQHRRKGEELYHQGDFAEASKRFNELELSYLESDHQPYYRFMTRLCDARDTASRIPAGHEDSKNAHDNFREFLRNSGDDARQAKFLEQFKDDLGKTAFKLAEVLTDWAKKQVDQPRPGPDDLLTARALLNEAQGALTEAGQFRPAPGDGGAVKLQARLADVAATADRHERRNQAVERLTNLVRVSSPMQAVAAVQEQLAREARALSDLPNDSDVRQLLNEALNNHRAAINYTGAKAAPPVPVEDDPDRLSNLLLVPPVGAPVLRAPTREEVIFAVARGVLYALDAETGKPLWATRVGRDATQLPVWLPHTDKGPALVLVASADRAAVTAREALTGKPRWRHRLQSPCLGRPLLVNGHIYVPGYDGRIDELDLSGKLLGYFQVGSPLTVGGAHQEGTSLLYFPEDSFTIYVLDVAVKKCAGILYSEHPSGSLRCAPVVINSADGAGQGHLILCQADGVDAMKLRVFSLPVARSDAAPNPEIRLTGWASAPPYQDGETLAVVTDSGQLKLLGLRQKGNRDPDFFPLLARDLNLRGDDPGALSQIAHSDGYQFWALTQGSLHRLRKSFDRQSGPKLVEQGHVAEVGSPLHATQTDAEGQTLFVTARRPSGQSTRMTAFDLREKREGQVRWQRQLGLVPRTAPLGSGARVLLQDLGGALFLFDADDVPKGDWAEAGQALTGPGGKTALLRALPAKGGNDVYVLTFRGRGVETKLQVRRLAAKEKELDTPRTFPLTDGLNGVPGVWENHLVLPLASGILYRRPLDDSPGIAGPGWRAQQAEPGAAGYVVPVGKTDFLATDGDRGLRYFDWPPGQLWKEKGFVQVNRPVAASPFLLPRTGDRALRVCVADAGGVLTLLQGDELKAVREWPLGGSITAGPFARGGEIGAVVEKRRLVWVDPEREKFVWEYLAPADIVGEPALADGLLVVADQSGRIVALDPKTGREAGPPFVFQDSVCPTTAPLPFGEGRVFVLLSDGTAAVLPVRLPRQDLKDTPAVR